MARPRRIQLALSAYSLVVFTILWIGALAALVGAWQPADAWVGFTGLAPAVQLTLIVVATPAVVALWASGAGMPGAIVVAVAGGLGVWTLAAVTSFRAATRGLRRS